MTPTAHALPSRASLIRTVGILLALGVVLATLLHVEQLRQSQLAALRGETAAANRAVMLALNHRLHAMERQFDQLAEQLGGLAPAEAAMPLAARAAGLSRALQLDEQRDALLREIAVVDAGGQLLASSRPGQFGRPTGELDLAPTDGGSRLHIGRAQPGRYLGEAGRGTEAAVRGGLIPISKTYPVPEGSITVVGTVGTDTLITEFRRLIPEEHHVVNLYRLDGRLLASSAGSAAEPPHFLANLRAGPHGDSDERSADDHLWMVSYRSAESLPLVAEIRTDYRIATARWHGELYAPLVVMVLFLAVILYYSRTVLSALDEQAALARQLDSRQRRHAGVLANAAEGIVTIDAGGIVREYNRAAERIFGLPAADVIGRPLSTVLADPHEAAHQSYVDRYLREGEPRIIGQGRKLSTRRRDGAPLDILLSVSETVTDGERLFTGIVHDITDSERQHRELVAARDAAEAAAQAKARFLAMMSHELRTPMTGILGMADLLAEAPTLEDQRRYVAVLRGSAQSLLTVLNDILDFSKIEAGKLVLEHIDFDPNAVLEEIRELFSPAASARGNTLLIERPGGILPALNGDPTRVRQILFNLVGNAIKFTEGGRVTVVARAGCPPGGGTWQLELEVRDTGIGIAPESLDTLFAAFQQGDSSTSRRFGGTGLGLTICRQLVEVMNGRISAESRVGAGSCFRVTLPLNMAARPLPADVVDSPVPDTHGGLSILIAEDNAVNRLLVNTRLAAWGHRLTVAENGLEAVTRVREAAEPFDIILMDMQMPVMDGAEATRAIRALPEPACLTPIVALTADAMPEFRERYMAAGLDDYLTKPVDWTALRQCLARTARRGETAVAPPETKVDASGTAPATDGNRLAELVHDLDVAGVRDLLQLFLETADEEFIVMRSARIEGNAERLRRSAHSVKGAAANLGFTAVADIARRLEKAPPDEVPALLARFEGELAQVRRLLPDLLAPFEKTR